MTSGKLILFSAPSGSGKSTIINALFARGIDMHFSISATSRPPRGSEKNGVEYFFLSEAAFRQAIKEGDLLEYNEVYPGRFYGTLRSQVDTQLAAGHSVVLDLDVEGAIRVKQLFGDQCLALFIQPPSIEELRHRLEGRATDSEEVINDRIARAEYELSFASQFDEVVINDDLSQAEEQAYQIITSFLEKN